MQKRIATLSRKWASQTLHSQVCVVRFRTFNVVQVVGFSFEHIFSPCSLLQPFHHIFFLPTSSISQTTISEHVLNCCAKQDASPWTSTSITAESSWKRWLISGNLNQLCFKLESCTILLYDMISPRSGVAFSLVSYRWTAPLPVGALEPLNETLKHYS